MSWAIFVKERLGKKNEAFVYLAKLMNALVLEAYIDQYPDVGASMAEEVREQKQ